MKTTRVSTRAKTLNDLLKKARRRALILETSDGQRFVLASIEGYELNDDADITKNKKLMKHLTERRGAGAPLSLADVKAELGLD
jgi:hypothetical protein